MTLGDLLHEIEDMAARQTADKGDGDDPVAALGDTLPSIYRAFDDADILRNNAEAALWKNGKCPWFIGPVFQKIGRVHCVGEEQIRDNAASQGEDTERHLSEYREKIKKRREARDKAGLNPHDEAVTEADARWREAYARLATTPATSPAGVAVKVRYLLEALTDGKRDADEDIARSAIADLERLAGGAS